MYLPKRYTHIQLYKLSPFQITKRSLPIQKKENKNEQQKTTGVFLQLAQNPRFSNLPPFHKNVSVDQKRFRWTSVGSVFFSTERLKQSLEMQMAADKKEMDQAKVETGICSNEPWKKGAPWWFSVYIGDEKFYPVF